MNSRLHTLMVLCAASYCVAGFSIVEACNYENRVPSQPNDNLERDLAEIESVWNAFVAALMVGDKEAALTYVNPDERGNISESLDLMGPFIKDWISDMLRFDPVEISDGVGLYVLCAKSDKYGSEGFPIYFLRIPELGWRLHKF